MSYPAYDPAYDSPVAGVYAPVNLRATLAAEDRDLLAEASDLDACVDAALEVTCALYPPLLFGVGSIPTIQN